MIIVDLEQGSDAWLEEKLGKPSASNASKIVTSKGLPSKQREAYLYELAAERLTGEKEPGYYDMNMLRGNEREEESRKLFEMQEGVKVQQVGVVYKDSEKQFLCSPDGLMDKIGLELKNVMPKTQVKRLLNGKLPSEYFQQVQMSMYVTGFDQWVFFSYSPGLDALKVVVDRDEKFIKALAEELNKFCDELDEIVRKLS